MAGIRGGADCIHTTVNGLGADGIPDLAETIVAFHNLEGMEKFNIQPLNDGFRLPWKKVSGFFMAPNKPITGQTPSPIKAVSTRMEFLKDPHTYEPFDPALLGREENRHR